MRVLFLLLLLIRSSGALANEAQVLHVVGSSTLAPLVLETGKTFDRDHNVRVVVDPAGSRRGIDCAIERSCDLGLSSESLKPEEAERAKAVHLGWDATAFVVSKDVAIDNISVEQLKSILSGKAKTWKDVGGASTKPIKVFIRDKKRGSTELLAKKLAVPFVGEEIGPNAGVINRLSHIENAISYTSLGFATGSRDKVKILSIDGVAPTPENVAAGKYPWRKELVFVVPKPALPVVEAFTDYVLSKKAELLKRFDFSE